MRTLPPSWQAAVGSELAKPYYQDLVAFVDAERATKTVFPPEQEVFFALELVPFEEVRVLLLGQDPYHDEGQAHGLCFSVKPPTKPPPSLRNIFKELESDLGIPAPGHGDLTSWGKQGVLLLNTVLTVEAHKAASHAGKGWEAFTDAIIVALSARPSPLVFCLWGGHAKKKAKLIDTGRHAVVPGAHPSPLSQKGFFGSRPFSAINAALVAKGQPPIDWRLA
jgi:uracil-DNA glycosylase